MLVSNPNLVHYVSQTAANRARVNSRCRFALNSEFHDHLSPIEIYLDDLIKHALHIS